MRIGIDIDDTVSKTNDYMVKCALEYDKKYVKGKGFKDKNAYSFMDMFYWTVVDASNFLEYIRGGKFFLELEPMDNAIEVINELKNKGHEIVFITRREDKLRTRNKTKKWFKNNGIKYDKIFFHCKHKGELCEDLGVDLFIDNDEANVYEAEAHGIKAILFDSIYNKDVADLKRITNWKEVGGEDEKIKAFQKAFKLYKSP